MFQTLDVIAIITDYFNTPKEDRTDSMINQVRYIVSTHENHSEELKKIKFIRRTVWEH